MKKIVSIILTVLMFSALAGCNYPGNVGNSPGASPYYDGDNNGVFDRDNRNTTNRAGNAVDNAINNGVDNNVNNGRTGNTGTRNTGTGAGTNAR